MSFTTALSVTSSLLEYLFPSSLHMARHRPAPAVCTAKTQLVYQNRTYSQNGHRCHEHIPWGVVCVGVEIQKSILVEIYAQNKWWFFGRIINQQRNIESCALVKHLEMDCTLIIWNQITERTHISQWLHHSVWCWILARECKRVGGWSMSVR